MLDEIVNFVKTQMGDQVQKDNGLSPDQQTEVFNTAHSSMLDTIKDQFAGGNFDGVMNLFNGQAENGGGSVSGGLKNSMVQNLMDKFGFDADKAGGIAQTIVPAIISRFSNPETGTASDPQDLIKKIGMDKQDGITDLISKFTNGGAGGIMDSVKGMFSGK